MDSLQRVTLTLSCLLCCDHSDLHVRQGDKKVLTTKKTITFIYRLIGYTVHDIIAIYYYWQRYYNPFAFLYINTKSEVGPQRLMTMKINKGISQI